MCARFIVAAVAVAGVGVLVSAVAASIVRSLFVVVVVEGEVVVMVVVVMAAGMPVNKKRQFSGTKRQFVSLRDIANETAGDTFQGQGFRYVQNLSTFADAFVDGRIVGPAKVSLTGRSSLRPSSASILSWT
mgnify:CR=1 FL=1